MNLRKLEGKSRKLPSRATACSDSTTIGSQVSRVSGIIASVAVVAASVAGGGAARAGDPTLDWKTIESAHFVVHYYEPNGDLAHRVAVVAERAHRVLAPALRHEPDEKTQVVITDDTDGSNGFAGVVPRNQINLFAAAPDSLSVLNDHDDWLYGLVAHEYSHILHLDTIIGIPKIYNKVFGKYWAPNNVQPRWFIEGLATYEESKRSSSGRTRNAIFETYLRMAVLSGKKIDLDALSSGPYFWPHGNAAYLYGSYFLSYIADRFGDDKIAAISHEYGAQPVPFGINRAVERVLGEDYVQLYAEWMAHLKQRFELQRAAVLRRGQIEGKKLTNTGEFNGYVRFSHDGKAIWWRQDDGKSDSRYREIPVDGDYSKVRDLATFHGGGRFSPLPDGSGFVVERGITYRTYYDFLDLYRIELRPGHPDSEAYRALRLTRGARARSPDVSPDGTRVAFTVDASSRERLAIMLLDSGKTEIVWQGSRWDQAFDPAWSPDGKTLAFSAWTQGGDTDIYLYDLEGKALTRLAHDRAIDVEPRFSPDGKTVYFTSDRTGIYNIYAYDRSTGELKQVTNVLAGAFEFDVSPDGKKLVYSGFDDDGTELYLLDLDPTSFLPAEIYVNDRPEAIEIHDDEARVSAPRSYRAIETLSPLTYTINTTKDSWGNAVSLSTSGSDAAGIQSWSLSVTYGLSRGDTSFGASYFTTKFWPSVGFSMGHSTQLSGGLILDGKNVTYSSEAWAVNGSMGIPLLRSPDTSSDLVLGYNMYWLRDTDGPIPQDPNSAVPRPPITGRFGGVTLSWSMSDVRGFLYSLGPVMGRGVSLTLHFEDPHLGSTQSIVQMSARWDEYLGLPWWGHVLALRAQGGVQKTPTNAGGQYFLGGVPHQDIVSSIINSTRQGGSWLRGYPPGVVVGHEYELLNVEYRIPLKIIEKGIATIPFYVRRLHLAALVDAGNAFDGAFDPADLLWSVGGSLRLDATFGYYVGGSLDVGVSRGLSKRGITEWWLLLTNTL
jgi:WD40 repeat protein